MPNGFKGRHFHAAFILLCVRWYLKFNIGYRHLAEMIEERGFAEKQGLGFADTGP